MVFLFTFGFDSGKTMELKGWKTRHHVSPCENSVGPRRGPAAEGSGPWDWALSSSPRQLRDFESDSHPSHPQFPVLGRGFMPTLWDYDEKEMR